MRPDLAGDVVARKDAGIAYHLAVVVDDALQGVTHVIRSRSAGSRARAAAMQTLLDLPEPTYRHHRLLADAEGEFAKRDRAETLADIEAAASAPGAAPNSASVE